MAATRELARAVAHSQPGDLPVEVERHALNTFVNFVGCALGGATHEAMAAAERVMLPQGASGPSRIVGRAARTSPIIAALLNGIAGAVNAYDDTHAEAIIHPGPPVGAALVAISSGLEHPIGGPEFLLAYAWGVELACRLSKAVSVAPAKGAIGWSQTGIAAPIGAAAAAGRLLRLEEDDMLSAIGIAASLASGLRVAHGSTAMHLAPAQAAMTGAQAALLAQAGVTGPAAAIEGHNGFFEMFAASPSHEHLLDGLGTRFELLRNMFKAHPAGIVIQAVIDACLALSAEGSWAPRDITGLVLEVPSITVALCDRPNPVSVFDAQVSAQHWAAATLLYGKAGLDILEPHAIWDPQVMALRARCRLVERPDMPGDASTVIVTFGDGSERRSAIDHYQGSLARPLDKDSVSRKFIGQTTRIFGEEYARRCLDACWALPEHADVNALWDVIAAPQ